MKSKLVNYEQLEEMFKKHDVDNKMSSTISSQVFEKLFVDGIQLITKLKSNMKGAIMKVSDRVLLRKRSIIETINDELKNMAQIEQGTSHFIILWLIY